jgi:hypothetical protein
MTSRIYHITGSVEVANDSDSLSVGCNIVTDSLPGRKSNSWMHPIVLTLKALANVSPGFALKPWVQNVREDVRNPIGVALLYGP